MEEEGALGGFLSRHRLKAPVQLGLKQQGSAGVHPHCWQGPGSLQVPYSKGQRGCSCPTPGRAALASLLPAPWGAYVGDPRGVNSDLEKDFGPSEMEAEPQRVVGARSIQHVVKVELAQRRVPQAEGSEQPPAFGPAEAPLLRPAHRKPPMFVSSGFPGEMRPLASTDEAARVMGTWGQSPFPDSTWPGSAQASEYEAEQHPWGSRCQDGSSVTWQGLAGLAGW